MVRRTTECYAYGRTLALHAARPFSGRWGGARGGAAVPRGAPCRRRLREARRGARRRAFGAARRGRRGDPCRGHPRCARGAHGRRVGCQSHELWRHGARTGKAGRRRGSCGARRDELTVKTHLVIATLAATALLGACGSKQDQIGRDTSELQSLMRISYAVFCLKKKKKDKHTIDKTEVHTHK